MNTRNTYDLDAGDRAGTTENRFDSRANFGLRPHLKRVHYCYRYYYNCLTGLTTR